jgi:hypothetical protein
MEGGKRKFKNVLLLEIICGMPCVRGNFLKVKSRGNKNKYIHFVTLFFMLKKTIPTYYVTEVY